MATQEPPSPAAAAASSSSSSVLTPKWNYDVFVSFRGEDTRKNFTDHLYMALDQKGIRTFKDDEKLERGKEISHGLLKAIEESRLSIIVLSNNYASSTWCLDELVKVLECKATMGQTVLPIFYNVDPSEVRKQTGTFAHSFAKYEKDFEGKIEKVQRWREALTKVANLSGWDLRSIADGHEAKFIQKIVHEIWSELNKNHTFLYVAKHPVGINSRVKKIKSLLDVGGPNGVRFIGICGIGGIGKTTIAKAIYNQIAEQFEGSCFLANVREVSKRHDGLLELQRELLSEILKEEKLNISNVDRGVSVMEKVLRHKRVLVILDDVDHLDQLEKLAGKPDWFGLGSRIILTTRDEHMLTTYDDHGIYRVDELNDNEALQLFSLYAFKENNMTSDLLELSNRVVKYCGGLPLALKVLGSFLFDKRSTDEWESALDKLQRIPNNDIHETLKVSFDGLDVTEKAIFLDVACFFNGEDEEYVTTVLESCGFYPNIGLSVLTQKSLITISNKRLWMHDLLIEMGRAIVRQEYPNQPGKHSRLWVDEDIYDVLRKNTGTETLEVIIQNVSSSEEVDISNEAFMGMHKLRLLKVSNVHPPEDFNYLPNELRCLYWGGYPLKSMPSRFRPKKLVELRMPYSCLEQLLETMILKNLEILDLSNSQYLKETPDFSGIPRLKKLILGGCAQLVEIRPSILVLHRLVFLNLRDCKSLCLLWRSVKFESLEKLILYGCSKLEKFPEVLGTMKHLSEVYLGGTGIKELPSSIEHLTGLVLLDLENCKNLTSLPSWICELKSLKILTLSGCSKLEKFPEVLGTMEHLWKLNLGGTGIKELPSSITHLTGLVLLDLENCKNLTSLPSSLCELKSLRTLTLSGCSKIDKLPENLGDLQNLVDLNLDGTAIRQPPASIVLLKNLQTLSFRGCEGSPSNSWKSFFSFSVLPRKNPCSSSLLLPSLSGLCSLIKLDLSGCNLSEGAILSDIVNLSSLQYLILNNNNFVSLPASLSQLNCLETLEMVDCTRLQALPPLPTSTRSIIANGCRSLEELSYPLQNLKLDADESKNYRTFEFGNCEKLASNQDNIRLQRLWEATLEFNFCSDLVLSGSKISKWFNHQSMGSSISFKMPPVDSSKFKGVALCAVFGKKDICSYVCKLEEVSDGISHRSTSLSVYVTDDNICSDHVWLRYEPRHLLESKIGSKGWCHILASFIGIMGSCPAIKCGVRVVYEEDEPASMQFKSPQNLGIYHEDFDKSSVVSQTAPSNLRYLSRFDLNLRTEAANVISVGAHTSQIQENDLGNCLQEE